MRIDKYLMTEKKGDVDVKDITEQALMAFWAEIDDMTPEYPNQVDTPDNNKITKMMMKEVEAWIKKSQL